MENVQKIGICIPDILLPEIKNLSQWACVACDQYTAQPEIWEQMEHIVGDAPSTLRIILPEIYLEQADARIERIHAVMQEYARDVLTRCIHGFVLTTRLTESGLRKGLVLAVDLEEYDFAEGSTSRIRATEGTIVARIPPRQKVRTDALLECPHILLLLNDPQCTVIEPLYKAMFMSPPIYSTALMQGGGAVAGYAVTDPAYIQRVCSALTALDDQRGTAPLFAVGDGNHSLASARAHWLQVKETISALDAQEHPARYALCEVVNLYEPALAFEPIHRVLFNVDIQALGKHLESYAQQGAGEVRLVDAQGERVLSGLPITVLQPVLDAYLVTHPQTRIDYVHEDEAARALSLAPGNCALLLEPMDKFSLFPAISTGPLPRKAFSLGHAHEKRFYLECRRIR